MREFQINKTMVGGSNPTYFIADIAANHDGDLERAKNLIRLAADSGADAAKFQNFEASTIVSDFGFKALSGNQSHQSGWKKSIFDVYQDASLPLKWTEELKNVSDKNGIDFFTAPYSIEMLPALSSFVCAWKVGSGDITWDEHLEAMARYQKPMLLATGAAEIGEVESACETILAINDQLVLMQCNTNYTGSFDNIGFVCLNVLNSYRKMFPDVVLGLSDHTPGHVSVLGAVALGARVVEKHFTDDANRSGPDHKFSMTPEAWERMVLDTRWLEKSLGDDRKRVMENERETVIVQRRSLRTRHAVSKGTTLKEEMLIPLRPCPVDGIPPNRKDEVVDRPTNRDLLPGEHITWDVLN